MIEFNISDDRWQEVAERLNGYYGTAITTKMLQRIVTDPYLLVEIAEGTYSDTSPREELIELLSDSIVGLSWPLFGTSHEKTEEFYNKAREIGFIK